MEPELLQWLVGGGAGGGGLAAGMLVQQFLYRKNGVSHAEFASSLSRIENRLDRQEAKLDRILESQRPLN